MNLALVGKETRLKFVPAGKDARLNLVLTENETRMGITPAAGICA